MWSAPLLFGGTQVITGSYVSCGVRSLYNMHQYTPEQLVEQVREFRNAQGPSIAQFGITPGMRAASAVRFSHIIFSDWEIGSPGAALARHIGINPALGEITASPSAINPNSGNRIVVWVWTMPIGDL